MPKHADLPQRLRDLAYHWRLKGFPSDAGCYQLAADEIDRLTQALSKIAADGKNCTDHCRRQAHHALGQAVLPR